MNTLFRLNEIRPLVLRAIESNPDLTQRQLVQVLGVSLIKVLYCMKVLMDKGLVKMGNFSHNQKKMDYSYFLPPRGMKIKATLRAHFLECKAAEYAMLKSELEKFEKKATVLEQGDKINITEEAV